MEKKLNETKFPIITKFIAWFLILAGLINAIFSLPFTFMVLFVALSAISVSDLESVRLESLFGAILRIIFSPLTIVLLPGVFLLRRRRWAWWFIVFCGLISLLNFISVIVFDFEFLSRFSVLDMIFSFIFYVYPIISVFLIIERKEFFKIAS